MNYSELELPLLQYWKSQEIKWLYKYKHGVKKFGGENRANIELFTDLTSGSMFRDIVDIANYSDVTAEEVKIDIDVLIANRQPTEG